MLVELETCHVNVHLPGVSMYLMVTMGDLGEVTAGVVALKSVRVELTEISFQIHRAVSIYLCKAAPLSVTCSSVSQRLIKTYEGTSAWYMERERQRQRQRESERIGMSLK